jgi:hypothetical protein
MRFIQNAPGLNHHTDDDAEIDFRRSADQAPTHLRSVGMGFCLTADSRTEFDVELAPFVLIGVGTFGDGRPSGGSSGTKWTGSSHTYGIYKHRRSLLIIESHGGGEQGYIDRHSHAIELFDQLCATLPQERLWDICYLIANTENRAYRKGRQELSALFLQGRLKRRRRNSQWRLEVIPESPAKQNVNSSV